MSAISHWRRMLGWRRSTQASSRAWARLGYHRQFLKEALLVLNTRSWRFMLHRGSLMHRRALAPMTRGGGRKRIRRWARHEHAATSRQRGSLGRRCRSSRKLMHASSLSGLHHRGDKIRRQVIGRRISSFGLVHKALGPRQPRSLSRGWCVVLRC